MTWPLFPPGFILGAAASAYQVEGGWNADGKGPSNRDALAHRPGGLVDGLLEREIEPALTLYHWDHPQALEDAGGCAGMDIRGHYVWSLLDNLEWEHGYRPRFGLIHVDFRTLARTPKESSGWYRDLIAAPPPPGRAAPALAGAEKGNG